MNRFGRIISVVAFGSVTLAAQRPTSAQVGGSTGLGQTGQMQGGSPSVYVVPVPAGVDCPVSMHAQQQSGLGILTARGDRGQSRRQAGIAQHIRLILGDVGNSARIVSAKVTVRGTSPKGRVMPTGLNQEASSDARKSLALAFDLDGRDGASADLVLPGFTSVTSITLDSLTYADGTIWQASNGKGCRTAPDLLMLIDAR